jgi:hypothetical protein
MLNIGISTGAIAAGATSKLRLRLQQSYVVPFSSGSATLFYRSRISKSYISAIILQKTLHHKLRIVGSRIKHRISTSTLIIMI